MSGHGTKKLVLVLATSALVTEASKESNLGALKGLSFSGSHIYTTQSSLVNFVLKHLLTQVAKSI